MFIYTIVLGDNWLPVDAFASATPLSDLNLFIKPGCNAGLLLNLVATEFILISCISLIKSASVITVTGGFCFAFLALIFVCASLNIFLAPPAPN